MGRSLESTLAIELGQSYFQAVQLTNEERPTLLAVASRSKQLVTRDVHPWTDSELKVELQNVVRQHRWQGLPVRFTAPSESAQFLWTRLPQVKSASYSEVARARLKQRFEEIDSLTLSVLPTAAISETEVEALVIAVPRQIINSRAELLSGIGLEPIACEVEAQPLVRMAIRDLQHHGAFVREMSTTITDIGMERTRFVVLQNGKIHFVRTVRFGFSRIVKAVSEALALSPEQALQLLRSGQVSCTSQDHLRVWFQNDWREISVVEEADSFRREIARLMTYFRTMARDRSHSGILERLVVCGEWATFSGFDQMVGRNLGIRIHVMNPLKGMRLSVSEDAMDELSQFSRWTTAVGLGIQESTCFNPLVNQLALREEENIEHIAIAA